MSNLTKGKISKSRNFKKEILNYLKNNPSGATITDIAKIIETTRITVTKYISVLETEGKIFSQKIGVYKLYFSAERTFFPKDTITSYYIGLLAGFNKEIANKDKYKEIGINIAHSMEFPFISQIPKDVLPKRGINCYDFLIYFGILYHYIDFLHDTHNIPEVKVIDERSKAVLHFKNLKTLEESNLYSVHYYIMSGIVEEVLSEILQTKTLCNVETIDLDRKEVELSIEIL